MRLYGLNGCLQNAAHQHSGTGDGQGDDEVEDMKEIYGMGERKFAKYGKQFFAAIEDYRREHPEAEFTGA